MWKVVISLYLQNTLFNKTDPLFKTVRYRCAVRPRLGIFCAALEELFGVRLSNVTGVLAVFEEVHGCTLSNVTDSG